MDEEEEEAAVVARIDEKAVRPSRHLSQQSLRFPPRSRPGMARRRQALPPLTLASRSVSVLPACSASITMHLLQAIAKTAQKLDGW